MDDQVLILVWWYFFFYLTSFLVKHIRKQDVEIASSPIQKTEKRIQEIQLPGSNNQKALVFLHSFSILNTSKQEYLKLVPGILAFRQSAPRSQVEKLKLLGYLYREAIFPMRASRLLYQETGYFNSLFPVSLTGKPVNF